MNQSLTLNRPKKQVKRTVCVEIEHAQSRTRLAQQRILGSSYAEVRCIRCQIHDGVLYLRGQVTSFYLKQLTQETVRSLEGIHAISNFVEVIDPDRSLQAASDASIDDSNAEIHGNILPNYQDIRLPIEPKVITECQLNSVGSQLIIGDL